MIPCQGLSRAIAEYEQVLTKVSRGDAPGGDELHSDVLFAYYEPLADRLDAAAEMNGWDALMDFADAYNPASTVVRCWTGERTGGQSLTTVTVPHDFTRCLRHSTHGFRRVLAQSTRTARRTSGGGHADHAVVT